MARNSRIGDRGDVQGPVNPEIAEAVAAEYYDFRSGDPPLGQELDYRDDPTVPSANVRVELGPAAARVSKKK